MPEPLRCYCRNCAYELTALPDEGRCPECGGLGCVESISLTGVKSPWWVRLWPLYVGELTLLPLLADIWRGWVDDGVLMVIFRMVMVHGFWMPPFLLVASIGWSQQHIAHRSRRIFAQVSACAALVAFPTVQVATELIHPTDAQSGLALLVMPIGGCVSAGIGGVLGALIARFIFR